MSCRFCEKAFKCGFNLRRHEKYCPLKDQGREMSEPDEPAMQKHKTAFEEMKMNLMHSGLDQQSAEEIDFTLM